jgi:hypothetical protein
MVGLAMGRAAVSLQTALFPLDVSLGSLGGSINKQQSGRQENDFTARG